MTRLLIILIFALVAPCFVNGQSENTEVRPTLTKSLDDTDYTLDPEYKTDGEYFPFALDDLKPGHKLLLQKMEKSEIVKHRIKSIKLKGQYTEKFDAKGNKTYERWDAWSAGSKFSYEFGEDGRPTVISILDEKGRTIGRAKYKYGERGSLLQAGELLFKYFPNGQLRSIENAQEIERYEYDTSHRLVHINFNWKPGVVGCGNRTTAWKGKYNSAGQLITEQIVGFPDNLTKHHQYTKDGRLIQTKTTGGFEDLTTKYFYTNGLLAATKT
jgi:YD repeat-containing protein